YLYKTDPFYDHEELAPPLGCGGTEGRAERGPQSVLQPNGRSLPYRNEPILRWYECGFNYHERMPGSGKHSGNHGVLRQGGSTGNEIVRAILTVMQGGRSNELLHVWPIQISL